MTNPSKAELRRLAEAVCDDYWSPDVGMTTAETMYACAAAPGVVLLLLDECEEYESGMRAIACNLGAGGYNAAELSAAELLSKVNWGIDSFATSQQNLADSLRVERDAALAELESLRIQVSTLTEWYSNALDVISEVSAAIPGVTYMDPPDGGDVSIPEQIQRMAKDAKRYLWLRTADWWSSQLCVVRDPKQQAKPGTDCPSRDRLDSAIDAAMAQEANHA